jgi:hypothetical protein
MNYGFILNGLTVNGFFSRFAPSRMTLLDSLIWLLLEVVAMSKDKLVIEGHEIRGVMPTTSYSRMTASPKETWRCIMG